MTENKRFVYEVTDTGKYYYENGVRIYPEDFWQIIHDLNNENEQLKKELEHEQHCFNIANTGYHDLQKLYQNKDISLEKCRKENEQLKFNIDIRDKGIIELKEENEQLKQRITTQSEDRKQLLSRIDELKREKGRLEVEIECLSDECIQKVFKSIDEKIGYNKRKLLFARKEGFTQLDNISYVINTLTELKEELKE